MAELKKTQSGPELFDDAPPPIPHMTEDEFVAWCNEDVRAEWVDGEVIVMSPASSRHNGLSAFLIALLREFVVARGLGQVFHLEYMVRFEGRQRMPDGFFVSKDRVDRVRPSHLEGPPDLAMEVVSPDSVERDWQEKYREYEAAGVREYWVIDPLQKRLQAYALGAEGSYRAVPETEGRVCSSVVPGFFLKSEWLWQEPPPSALDALREMGIIS